MRKLAFIGLITCLAIAAQAQTKRLTEHDPAIRAKDSLIKVQLIDPAEAGGEAPDWAALTSNITKKYDATYADRTITKAKIYFYYSKDWPVFCAAIVHFTNNYELANDFHILNANAGMILANSTDPKELQEALNWSKTAVAGDPANEKYKATLAALQAKIAGK